MTDTNRPDVSAFLAFLNNVPGPKMHELPPAAARMGMVAMRAVAEVEVGPLAVIRNIAIPGPAGTIPARLYDAREKREPGPVMVFYHGGGFVIGDLDTHEPYCAEVARVLDIPVIAIDYRLAPENPWPAAPDDCEAATRWIASSPAALGVGVTSLILSGDSAGGNLAIVTAMALRDAPAAAPVIVQFPIYPTVDGSDDWGSFHEHADGKLLTREAMAYFMDAYKAEADHVRAHPLGHDHTGMPATLIVTAGLDPLRDQGRAYAGALIEAGVPVTFREAVGNIHGFITLRKAIPSSSGDVAALLALLKPMIAEAEGNRVMRQAAA
jgi:acetyl esterase